MLQFTLLQMFTVHTLWANEIVTINATCLQSACVFAAGGILSVN